MMGKCPMGMRKKAKAKGKLGMAHAVKANSKAGVKSKKNPNYCPMCKHNPCKGGHY